MDKSQIQYTHVQVALLRPIIVYNQHNYHLSPSLIDRAIWTSVTGALLLKPFNFHQIMQILLNKQSSTKEITTNPPILHKQLAKSIVIVSLSCLLK